MSLFLKVFWIVMLSALLIGFIALFTLGVPSPSVDVKKHISIDSLLRK